MPEVPFAYGYQHLVRDVSSVLTTVNQTMPTLMSRVSIAGGRARQHKHEWPELVTKPEQSKVTAGANASATVLSVASKLPFEKNAICRIQGKEELLRVVAVSEAEEKITVVRGYGGTTAGSIGNGDKVIVVTKPRLESTTAQLKGDPTAPDVNHNFTEIFDEEAVVSLSQGGVYGVSADSTDPVGDGLNFQVMLKMQQLARRMNNALIYGRRVERTPIQPGTMGGLLQYMEGGNIVNAQGNPVDKKVLGDGFQMAFESGATRLNTMLCGSTQARNVSALYGDQLQVLRQDTTLGYAVYQVRPDMPIEGYVSTVVVDPNFPDNMIEIFDDSNIEIVAHRVMQDKDATPPGADFVARRMIGEYTARFNALGKLSTLIKNLSTVVAGSNGGGGG